MHIKLRQLLAFFMLVLLPLQTIAGLSMAGGRCSDMSVAAHNEHDQHVSDSHLHASHRDHQPPQSVHHDEPSLFCCIGTTCTANIAVAPFPAVHDFLLTHDARFGYFSSPHYTSFIPEGLQRPPSS